MEWKGSQVIKEKEIVFVGLDCHWIQGIWVAEMIVEE
jgi:hypothetical protein